MLKTYIILQFKVYAPARYFNFKVDKQNSNSIYVWITNSEITRML